MAKTDLIKLEQLCKKCTDLILDAKERHTIKINENLNYLLTAPKTYWPILNPCFNNIKVPSIHLH